MGFLASLDPEVTKVCQASPDVRVCPDFQVLLSRVKDSRDSLGSRDSQDSRASQDPKEKLELWDSLACLGQGVMMVHLVTLATLEKLVVPASKVYLEIRTDILEVLELKACQEIQDIQEDVATMEHLVTMASLEVQVSPE